MDKNKFDEHVEIDCYIEEQIHNLQKAEYDAKRYIKTCEYRIKEYQDRIKKAKERIEQLEENTKSNIYYTLNKALIDDTIPNDCIKENDIKSVYSTPSARFILSKSTEEIKLKDEKKFIEYLNNNGFASYVEVIEKAMFKQFFANCKVIDGNIIDENGEILIIDGVEIEEKEENFSNMEIKYL